MPHTKITQAFVEGLPFHDSTDWYHDTELAGFNLSVGRRGKTYYAAAENDGRFMRVKIGRVEDRSGRRDQGQRGKGGRTRHSAARDQAGRRS